MAVILLVLATVALGVAVLNVFTDLRRLRDSEAAGAEALAAARSVAADMLSYSHQTVEADLARARGYTTGELTEHLRTLAATLVPRARKERTVQETSVVAAGVESATPDSVRVLLFVNMNTTRLVPGEREPRFERSPGRARLVMRKVDAGWRVAELSTLLGSVPAE